MSEEVFVAKIKFAKDYDKKPNVGDYVVAEEDSENSGEFFREGFVGKILSGGEDGTFFIDFNYVENSFCEDDGKWYSSKEKLTRLVLA